MCTLQEEVRSLIRPSICSQEVGNHWFKRVVEGGLTRDEGNPSHLGCYFVPYNLYKKEVFIVHHKKSGLWLFPGGHVDRGESLHQTLNREIEEKLGLKQKILAEIKPFLLTTTPISHPGIMCREHLDLWYRFHTNGSNFKINMKEFHKTKWTDVAGARGVIIDQANLEALSKMEELFSSH